MNDHISKWKLHSQWQETYPMNAYRHKIFPISKRLSPVLLGRTSLHATRSPDSHCLPIVSSPHDGTKSLSLSPSQERKHESNTTVRISRPWATHGMPILHMALKGAGNQPEIRPASLEFFVRSLEVLLIAISV